MLWGIIHVQNRDRQKNQLSTEILEYVYQFSKVLRFFSQNQRLFQEKVETVEKYESTIIDISAAGLLFCFKL
jgi:hypothetical protein